MKKILASFVIVLATISAQSQIVSDLVNVHAPDDLEVDKFGNIWVNYNTGTSPDTFHLAKITPAGVLTNVITSSHVLGQFGVNDSIIQIAGPWGAAEYVYKYNHSGVKLDSLSMPYATAIILDPDGTWYVTQNAMGKLTRVLPDNTVQTVSIGSPLAYNLALARDENGTFYTCNLMNAKVIKIDPNTGVRTLLTTLPTSSPYSLGFLAYSNGHLYVPSFKNCIYKVDTVGNAYSVFAGTEGSAGDLNGNAATALFNGPTSVAFSITGDTLYFSDAANNKIKMITGIIALGIGNNQQTESEFLLYPNPAIENLFIQLKSKNETITTIQFISIDGKIIDSIDCRDSEPIQLYNLALNHLPAGTYFLNITTSSGVVSTEKFIKQ